MVGQPRNLDLKYWLSRMDRYRITLDSVSRKIYNNRPYKLC